VKSNRVITGSPTNGQRFMRRAPEKPSTISKRAFGTCRCPRAIRQLDNSTTRQTRPPYRGILPRFIWECNAQTPLDTRELSPSQTTQRHPALPPSSFLLPPSSFLLHPSSFPSFRLPPSAFIPSAYPNVRGTRAPPKPVPPRLPPSAPIAGRTRGSAPVWWRCCRDGKARWKDVPSRDRH
jgi:hypothetical protein